jgi:hypothetical protein
MLRDREQRALDMWGTDEVAESGGGHVRLWRTAGGSDNSDPEAMSLRTGRGRRFHSRCAEGGLMTPSGYGEGAVTMGVAPVNTPVVTLPVPRIRPLRV